MSHFPYRGRNIGRLLHFLYQFSTTFDHCRFRGSDQTIWLGNKIVAEYQWQEGTDIPIFTFYNIDRHEDFERFNHEQEWRIKEILELDRRVTDFWGRRCPECDSSGFVTIMPSIREQIKESKTPEQHTCSLCEGEGVLLDHDVFDEYWFDKIKKENAT